MTGPIVARKKPVVVQAFQLDGSYDGALRVIEWMQGRTDAWPVKTGVDDGSVWPEGHALWGLDIKTLETGDGNMHRATHGDYVIRGVKGEYYPCKPDIFEATYEAEGPPPLRDERIR